MHCSRLTSIVLLKGGDYKHSGMNNDYSINNSWLGRWFLIKTFDKLDEGDEAEIRRILEEDEDEVLFA